MNTYARWCVSAASVLLLLLAVEVAANVYYFVRRPRVDLARYCGNAALEPSDRGWCTQFVVDQARYQWRARYESYVLHRSAPFASPTINVDAKGLRSTPGSAAASDGATRIFVFGGSTILGVNVPDDRTVPALLVQRLKQAYPDRRFHVRNYGVGWWVSTQSMMQLLLELRAGERPDIVVFYDGINDIDALAQDASAHPRAGDIWPDLRQALERTVDPPDPRYGAKLLDALNSSRAVSLTRLFIEQRFGYPKPPAPDEPTIRASATDVVRVYRGNLALVRALAQAYGFRFVAFWQPSPLVGARSSACDAHLLDGPRREFPYAAEVYRDIYDRMRQVCGSNGECTYLGDLFDRSVPRCPYVDEVGHLAPWANAWVANAIVDRVSP